MSQELLVKYHTELDYILDIENDLKQMHPDDLYFVLTVLLPEDLDIDLTIKELNQRWMK